MEFLKNPYIDAGVVIVCVVIFYFAGTGRYFGRFLYDRFSICVQNPMNSFPCFGIYDIALMIVTVLIGLVFLGFFYKASGSLVTTMGLICFVVLTFYVLVPGVQALSTNSRSPMTLETAQDLAVKKINENSQYKMVIIEVLEKPDGWVFFYDSEEAVKTGDWKKYGVPGNVPLFVDQDGSFRYLDNRNDPLLSR